MREISATTYAEWRATAEITAADHFGDKVLLLADGTYLKLFRVKRLFTSARLFPYWRRFCRNAQGLSERGILTVQMIDVIRIPSMDRTAVHYRPLPGKNLREIGPLDAPLVLALGKFFKTLHDKGVYLRSIHLGNVILTPEGELGLIDIADMKIHSNSLSHWRRVRNFHHVARYEEDKRAIARHLDQFLISFDYKLQSKLKQMFA